MKKTYFTLNNNSTIRQCLSYIEKNKLGIIFLTNSKNEVVGCATDGDIRTKLLNGVRLDDCIKLCYNKNFVHVDANTDREQIIKKFDSSIKIIPVLDENFHLIELLTPNDFPLKKENYVISRAKSPVRISFGGGGSDLTHYFINNKAAVINATISLYSHATLQKRNDKKIIIFSTDLASSFEADNFKKAVSDKKNKFGLILSIINLIKPDFGFELYLRSDYPMNSGLGGSAAVISSIIGCFNEFRIDKWNKYEIAEMAYQSERIIYKISGGWQDQYATVFGGINLIEFNKGKNIINSLRIEEDILLELRENLILCDTCLSHNSSGIHDDQKKELENNKIINELVRLNVDLTYSLRDSLIKGDLSDFGIQLDKGWKNKKRYSKKISNERLDKIYNTAIQNGALGGKLLGAGGGGFFLFYCNPLRRWEVVKSLIKLKTKIVEFNFENEGLKSWKIRKNEN